VPLPEPTLGLLIVAARHAIRQAITARARELRLTAQQFWALYSLRHAPALTPGELGAYMHLDAPAASRLIADLAKRKLLDARPDREDRRRMHLHLTEKGAEVAGRVEGVAVEYIATQTRGLSADELAALRSGLRKVVENLAGFTTQADRRGRSIV
jgi:DNA-binding MarR family transcriptional regulator